MTTRPTPRRLTFAVTTSLWTASAVLTATATGCDDPAKPAEPGTKGQPAEPPNTPETPKLPERPEPPTPPGPVHVETVNEGPIEPPPAAVEPVYVNPGPAEVPIAPPPTPAPKVNQGPSDQ